MPKQAVLLIHGIGEQRPMDSLRAFVKAVWTTDSALHRQDIEEAAGLWSKPYPLSQNFELRRLTTAANRAGLRTDFFELYWAHLMQGTRIRHVFAWVKTLLLRRPSTVPRHLRFIYWILIGLVAIGVLMVSRSLAVGREAVTVPAWASWAMSLVVVPAIIGIVANVVGDAARYLHIAPVNVQRRHEIRAAGVQVLQSLHEQGYRRIIVVGHSLGSVIGYDILSYAWALYNTDQPNSLKPAYTALGGLEKLTEAVADGQVIDVAAIQQAQRRYCNELLANQVRWRVTDFVTLGSPLAHAEILLARDAEDLKTKFTDRELPQCPPVLERVTIGGVFLRRFSYPLENEQRVPHHAAVFGPTRWTNLYFPSRLIVWGDLIGGRLQPVFGAGVRDLAVRTNRWFGFLSHTLYWRLDEGDNQHVAALRAALDLLDEHRESS